MKFLRKLHSKLNSRFLGLDEKGQSTAEYGLVIVGAAALAGIFISFAGGGAINSVFNKVIQTVMSHI